MKIVKKIEAKLSEYEIEYSEGLFFSAYSLLGEVYVLLDNISQGKVYSKYICKINAELEREVFNFKLYDEYLKESKRLCNIIETGSKFIYEEFILIFTLRFQLYFITILFTHKSVQFEGLEEIDLEIKKIGFLKQNKQAYQSAIGRIRKNWEGIAEEINLFAVEGNM